MKKRMLCSVLVILSIGAMKAEAQGLTLLAKRTLRNYPSGSALEYANGNLYLLGDDATHILVLDKALKVKQRIPFWKGKESRISKSKKWDFESLAYSPSTNNLEAFGSFSTKNRFKHLWLSLDPSSKPNPLVQDEGGEFLLRLIDSNRLNIEGAARMGTALLLGNRGIGGVGNSLIYFISTPPELVLPRSVALSTPVPAGLSGLHYAGDEDLLLLSFSTEATANTYDDGVIGESYLGLILSPKEKIETSLRLSTEHLIPLSQVLGAGSYKIESVCAAPLDDRSLLIFLTADNDNGQTTLYKLRLEKSLYSDNGR